jgi:DNA-binding PadR family transcriptional regulator
MAGSSLSDVELTILSLVAEGPRYGSELEQMIELRGLREWLTVGSASVYYVLGRLEQQELLTSTAQNGKDGQARTVYQITDAGRGVAQTAIADLLCQTRPFGQGFSLGLANCGILKPAQVYNSLVQHQDRLTHHIHSTQMEWDRRQREEKLTEGTEALYTHGLAVMRAELDWLTKFLEDWQVRHPNIERDDAPVSDDQAQTLVHRPTVDIDQGRQLQKIKRPKKTE